MISNADSHMISSHMNYFFQKILGKVIFLFVCLFLINHEYHLVIQYLISSN